MFTVVYGGVRWGMVVYGGHVGVWWCMAYIMYNCNSAPAAGAVTVCNICGLGTAEVVLCRNKHALCMLDFSKTFKVEIGHYRQRFLSNACKLFCPLCPKPSSRPDNDKVPDFARKCASNLSDEVWGLYEGAITEAAVIAAQQECELRFKGNSKQASQDPDEVSVGKMMLSLLHHHTPPYTTLHQHAFTVAATSYISEHLVYPRCPNCLAFTPDFEACAGLECTKCHTHICAWCFSTHKNNQLCHAHVLACPFNLAPGKLYPPSPHPVLWWSVMHEWARKRIREYIMYHVASNIQQRVHDVCRQMHPNLGLVADGVQDSGDGFRPLVQRAAPTPSFEENVSRLIVMGLATQTRAEHVLEGLGNNVVAAVDLLLGYSNGPGPD